MRNRKKLQQAQAEKLGVRPWTDVPATKLAAVERTAAKKKSALEVVATKDVGVDHDDDLQGRESMNDDPAEVETKVEPIKAVTPPKKATTTPKKAPTAPKTKKTDKPVTPSDD